MNIGIVAGAFSRFGEDRYKKMKELGFLSADFSLTNTENEIYLCSEQAFCERLTKEKELAARSGIKIYQIHGPWRCPIRDFTKEDRAERLEKMKKAVRGAALLGAPCMVIHPVMPFGIFDIEKEKTGETWDINLQFMRLLVAHAKEYDITVCLENMPFPTFSLSVPEKIRQLVMEIDDKHFQMCLDTGHVNVFPDLSVANELRNCKDVIRALHVHDNNGKGDNHALPYFGTIDWEAVGKTLGELDLPCPFSYETVPPAKLPVPIYEAYLHSMVDIAKSIT